ncbi:MAG: Smr/MutS family protein [Desulfonatronovibrio sp.]
MKSLRDLKKVKVASRKKSKAQTEVKKETLQEPVLTDDDVFSQAMQGVKPLEGKGREIAQDRPRQNVPYTETDNSLAILNNLVNGHIEFDIEYSDEYIQGFVQGINSKTFRKLKSGKLSIQAHLDLHGLNTLQARIKLLNFMREQYINSKKCLLLIPGRGRNSPLGTPVLRNEVQTWLIREPLKRIVLAFCSAQPRHGGTGALYVLLRNYKKSGKILWDKYLMDIEDL